jgi:hypothetical protein
MSFDDSAIRIPRIERDLFSEETQLFIPRVMDDQAFVARGLKATPGTVVGSG